MIAASVYIIALNEERNIRRALESVKDFEQIVVVDSGSTDKTLEIAREYTDNVSHNDWVTEYDQRTHALSLCDHEWVLSLDADERIDERLRESLIDVMETDDADGLKIRIMEYFMGHPPHKWVKHSNRIKFFKKDLFTYGAARVHIPGKLNGRAKQAKGFMIHYGEKSVDIAAAKNNKYAGYKALDKYQKGKRASRLRLALIFPFTFLKYYFLRRHILSGTRGFVLSVDCAHYAFLKEAKLYEMEHGV